MGEPWDGDTPDDDTAREYGFWLDFKRRKHRMILRRTGRAFYWMGNGLIHIGLEILKHLDMKYPRKQAFLDDHGNTLCAVCQKPIEGLLYELDIYGRPIHEPACQPVPNRES